MSQKAVDNIFKYQVEDGIRPNKKIPLLMPDGTIIIPNKRKIANSNP